MKDKVFKVLKNSPLFRTCQHVFLEATGYHLRLSPADRNLSLPPRAGSFPRARKGLSCRRIGVQVLCEKMTVAVLRSEGGDETVEDLLMAFAIQLSRCANEIASRVRQIDEKAVIEAGKASRFLESRQWSPYEEPTAIFG